MVCKSQEKICSHFRPFASPKICKIGRRRRLTLIGQMGGGSIDEKRKNFLPKKKWTMSDTDFAGA